MSNMGQVDGDTQKSFGFSVIGLTSGHGKWVLDDKSDGELEVGWMDACMGHEGRVSGMWVVGLENRNVGKVVWDHA